MQARPVVSRMVRTMDDLAMIIHACYMGYSFPVTGVVDLWNVKLMSCIESSPLGPWRRKAEGGFREVPSRSRGGSPRMQPESWKGEAPPSGRVEQLGTLRPRPLMGDRVIEQAVHSQPRAMPRD